MLKARPQIRLYDTLAAPLVVGRAASLPIQDIIDVYEADDPLAATKELFRRHNIARQALATASTSLWRAVQNWLDGIPLRNSKTPLRALAYLTRMAARPTPFGLCAGVGQIGVGDDVSLAIDENSLRTYTRPDMALVLDLAKQAESSKRARVKYAVNTCRLERGGRLYVSNPALANRKTNKNGHSVTEQRAISLKQTKAITFICNLCGTATAYMDIVGAVSSEFGASQRDSEALVNQLVQAGLLVSELVPSPLADPIAQLEQRFKELDAPFSADFSYALTKVRRLDATPLAARNPDDYLKVHAAFDSLASTPTSNALQIDLRTSFLGSLSTSVLADAALLAELYVRCGPVLTLSRLRRRFEERYEGSDRMVPLLELTDPNLGLVSEALQVEEHDDDRRTQLLVDVACESIRTRCEEVELDQAQVDILFPAVGDSARIPRSIEIGFQVAATSRTDVKAGRYLVVPSGFVVTSGAAKTVGRFAAMLGSDFLESARDSARATADPSELVAELTFPPADARAYNVVMRPNLYEYEVAIGIPTGKESRTLPPTDLWIGLDGGRFFLWSESESRRVDVRETHAYATDALAPNLCRLLAILGSDGERGIVGFRWGSVSNLNYLPRIRVGRVVVSPRHWTLRRAALGPSAAHAERALEQWRAQWHVPRHVFLTDRDHRLLIDLDSAVAPELLIDQCKADTLSFVEALPSPEQIWVPSKSGVHVVEFVASARCARPVANQRRRHPVLVPHRTSYGPGSNWIYAQLYLGQQAATNHLVSEVAPLVQVLRRRGLIDRWFFLRYADPDHHLRVRILATDRNAIEVRDQLLQRAESWLRADQISRWALVTYEPEFERYGGPENIAALERFFEVDSDRCIEALASKPASTDALVEAGAVTFDALIHANAEHRSPQLALEAPPTKLNQTDRAAVKRLIANASVPEEDVVAILPDARYLSDVLHMHCNRLGLDAEGELRVVSILRALIQARRARAEPQSASADPAPISIHC